MVNYECLIIQANKELEARGEEPLYAVYPYDGLSIADSPLGYVDKGDDKQEELFLKLQEYLLSEETQNEICLLYTSRCVLETVDNQITLIEVGNGEGAIGSSGYFPSYSYYTRALDKGWHVAPTNNQDNHKGNWGDSNTARSVVLATDLSEEAIYDAMKNYRCLLYTSRCV